MSRLLIVLLSGFLFAATSFAGASSQAAPAIRDDLLAAVNAEFLRIRPCGVESGPSRYLVDHVATEGEWGCMAGSARYAGPAGPFAVEFIALLRWKCDGWRVASISFNAAEASRPRLVGLRQVPPSILPRSIRWRR
jgi:hypothetical protein